MSKQLELKPHGGGERSKMDGGRGFTDYITPDRCHGVKRQ